MRQLNLLLLLARLKHLLLRKTQKKVTRILRGMGTALLQINRQSRIRVVPTPEPTSEPKPTPTPKPVWGWANAKGTIKTTYDSATNGSNIPIEIPNMPVSGETCDGELTGYGKSTDATEEAVWNYLDNKFGEDFCGVGHLKVVDGSVHW